MRSAMASAGEQIYATLLLTDSYLPGALVLAHSLRDAGTSKKLAVFSTLDGLSPSSISQLHATFDYVIPVPRIRNEHRTHLDLLNRPDLDSAYTKINLWKQTQFSKIVYLDADVVAYRAPDELFTLQHAFSAAPDIGWPDIFNSGVMVLTPNMGDYYSLFAMVERGVSFDGADQGLLNMYFGNSVHRLSFTYNVTPSAHYQYIPAYRHFQSSINMAHFIGTHKPWLEGRHELYDNSPLGEMLARWWSVYDRHYRTPLWQQFHCTSIQSAGTNQPLNQQKEQDEKPFSHEVLKEQPHQPANSINQTQALPQIQITKYDEDESLRQVNNQTRPRYKRSQSWDASKQPPPKDSKPEAENFPTPSYAMSQDFSQFVPPARYPSPPKDMWFEVPKKRPAPASSRPKAIFPWEGQQPEASRTFPAVPYELSKPVLSSEKLIKDQHLRDEISETRPAASESSAYSAPVLSNLWSSFKLVNAWDNVPEIGRYIERNRDRQRGKSSQSSFKAQMGLGSRDVAPQKSESTFEGLKLTDFPTEVERPSLPVTPAPICRFSLWGSDGSRATEETAVQDIPSARGVPNQTEWNPVEQLQKLAACHSEELLHRLSGAVDENFDRLGELSFSKPPLEAESTPN